MQNLNSTLEPGMFVQHPDHPEWGTGQVQSNIAGKTTVNFPEVGKIVVDGAHIQLVLSCDAP